MEIYNYLYQGVLKTNILNKEDSYRIICDITKNGDISYKDIYSVAERINPKRSFLFVSKLLGRYTPIDIETNDSHSIIEKSYDSMALSLDNIIYNRIYNKNHKYFIISMAETATQMAIKIAHRLKSLENNPNVIITHSTRHPNINEAIICSFEENHSHATTHYIQCNLNLLDLDKENNATLILIDDEFSTGNMLINASSALISSLKNKNISVNEIITMSFLDWRSNSAIERLNFIEGNKIDVKAISLLNGEIEFIHNNNKIDDGFNKKSIIFNNEEMSKINYDCYRSGFLLKDINYIKYNYSNLSKLISNGVILKYKDIDINYFINNIQDRKMLFIASGENHYLTEMIAKDFSSNNKVILSSLARSPIVEVNLDLEDNFKDYTDYPIKSKKIFHNSYGINYVPNYLYNISFDDYDYIYFVFETDTNYIPKELLNLNNKNIYFINGAYLEISK